MTARFCRLTTIAAAFVVTMLAIAMTANAQAWHPAPGHTQLALWPAGVPDSQPARGSETAVTPSDDIVAGRLWTSVRNVSVPTITRYSPKAKLNTHDPITEWPQLVERWLGTIGVIDTVGGARP